MGKGKVSACLLSIVFQLFLIAPIFAGDDVRKVQDELRKRHLFSGNPTGEITPALTAAVARYQGIKGFPRTGIIDFQTRASLGVVAPEPQIASTPIVFENCEDVRGANGERLPISPSWGWMADQRAIETERARREENHAVAALTGTSVETLPPAPVRVPVKHRSTHPARQVKPRNETNPFLLAFHSIDRAMKQLRGDRGPKKKQLASRGL